MLGGWLLSHDRHLNKNYMVIYKHTRCMHTQTTSSLKYEMIPWCRCLCFFLLLEHVASTIQVSLSSPKLHMHITQVCTWTRRMWDWTPSTYHSLHASSCLSLCEVFHFVGVPLLCLQTVMHDAVIHTNSVFISYLPFSKISKNAGGMSYFGITTHAFQVE